MLRLSDAVVAFVTCSGVFRDKKRFPATALLVGLTLHWLAGYAGAQYVYFGRGGGQLHRASIDGSSSQLLLDRSQPIYAIAIDPISRKLYWSEWTSIYIADEDGTNLQLFLAGTSCSSMAIDPYARLLYYTRYDTPSQIRRIGLDGANDQLVIQSPIPEHRYNDIELHQPSGKIYWTVYESNAFHWRMERANLDGTQVEQLPADNYAYQFAIDPIRSSLFWILASPQDPVYRTDLNAANAQALSPAADPKDVALDIPGEKIYWPDYLPGKIMRMNMDGSGVEIFQAGITVPEHVTVLSSTDCNNNGIDDWCDINCGSPGGYCDVPGCGTLADVDQNQRLDTCDDCNGNGLSDQCDLSCGPIGGFCDLPGCGSGPDCNQNAILDACDLLSGYSYDCNGNTVLDECDTAGASSPDCNLNSVPDECETLGDDCNNNGIRDDCDTLTGPSEDCNLNLIPDECETLNVDCNNNGIRDDCDIATGPSEDCNLNGVPDECDPPAPDCNANSVRDDCDLISGYSNDCNTNLIPDDCEVEDLPPLLYWGDRTTGKIMRSSVTGGAAEEIVPNAGMPLAMTIDPVDRKIYWTDGNSSTIKRADLDGSNAEIFLSSYFSEGLALDVQLRKIYWTSRSGTSNGWIRRANLDGSEVESLTHSITRGFHDLAFHSLSTSAYFLQVDSDVTPPFQIYHAFLLEYPYSRSGLGLFAHAVAVDPVRGELLIAWGARIYRHGLQGGSSIDSFFISSSATRITEDALDGDGQIYWSSSGAIYRASRIGGSPQQIQGGLPNPGPLAVYRETDCNSNGVDDVCDISCGTPCGPCDVFGCGQGIDCDRNGLLDICEPFADCNGNGTNDRCDLAAATSTDCNLNLVPDECDGNDCNGNAKPDQCDLAAQTSEDCNNNLTPDECDIATAQSTDCNETGVPDECEPSSYYDCNANGQRDDCDLDFGVSLDADGDLIPDECYAEPDPLASDPTGLDKCRVISFVVQPVPGGAAQSALRVKFVSLHHPNPPYSGGGTYPFSIFEGATLWVGPPTQFFESSANPTPFYGAYLQCQPHFRDWSTIDLLHVTGAAIVPSSLYEVQNVAAGCEGNLLGCAAVSPSVQIATTRWGDVEADFNPPAPTTQPDLADVSALVNKFKNAPGAPIKVRAILADSYPSLMLDLDFTHIAACVDAYRGLPYPLEPGFCKYENEGQSCGGLHNCGGDGYCTLCP